MSWGSLECGATQISISNFARAQCSVRLDGYFCDRLRSAWYGTHQQIANTSERCMWPLRVLISCNICSDTNNFNISNLIFGDRDNKWEVNHQACCCSDVSRGLPIPPDTQDEISRTWRAKMEKINAKRYSPVAKTNSHLTTIESKICRFVDLKTLWIHIWCLTSSMPVAY